MPLKAVTIRDPNAPEEQKAAMDEETPAVDASSILERPLHDTGSKWFTFLSFLLPPVGLIGGWIFKKFNHIRNFKACKKGAIAGFITLGAIVALFGLALLAAVI